MKVSISYGAREELTASAASLVGDGTEKAIVYHEPAVEEAERFYEVMDAVGDMPITNGFAVLNNIAVTEEGRSTFEARFQNRARLIEKEPGFQAIRVLRPLTDDTYVIMTIWESEDSFKNWQQSQAYEKAHQKRHTPAGMDQQKSIFPRPSFVTTFHLG